MWVFWVEFESGPLCRLERRVEDVGCRVVSVEGVVSALCGDFRFREAVGVDWELGVGPVPAGGAAGVSAAATSGAGANGWAAAWLAAKRAADLVSLCGDGAALCAGAAARLSPWLSRNDAGRDGVVGNVDVCCCCCCDGGGF